MGINEDIIALRERMAKAVESDLIDSNMGGTFQVSLIQIMKEAETKKQSCLKQADHFKRQAINAEGQAAAYGTISSIVNAVFQSMMNAEERRILEEKERSQEEAEIAAEEEREARKKKAAPKKTTTRKKKTSRKKTTTSA